MAAGLEAAFAAEALAQGDEFGGLDLLDLACVEADEQVVGPAAVDELIVGLVLLEQDALDDAGVLEQADGAVDGGLGDAQARALEGGEQGIGLELTPAARAHLAEKGYDPQLGARPLRRAIQQLVEDPLSERILWKEFRVGETIVVDVEESPIDGEGPQLSFTAIEGIQPPPLELAGAGADAE